VGKTYKDLNEDRTWKARGRKEHEIHERELEEVKEYDERLFNRLKRKY